jgi:Uma2 family endonuclease
MAQSKRRLTPVSPEDYLAGENDGERRHEYVNGDVYAMAGTTRRHNDISGNIFGHLFSMLQSPCRPYSNDFKVGFEDDADHVYYYPDVFVTCTPGAAGDYVERSPLLVFEVLSKTTERYDRNEKRLVYQRIQTLMEYALVSQEFPQVDVYRRGTGWEKETFKSGATITFESIGKTLTLDQIYRDIDFTKPAD